MRTFPSISINDLPRYCARFLESLEESEKKKLFLDELKHRFVRQLKVGEKFDARRCQFFHLTGEKATGTKRLKKVFFFVLGTGADRFVYSSIIRLTGLSKDGKMRSLRQFYDRTSDFPSSDEFFFLCFSAFPKHLRKHTKHFTRTTETRPAEEIKKFTHRILVQLQ